jgi:hypothetical protein
MAGKADKTLRGADTLLSSAGKTAATVFTGTNGYDDGGQYRLKGGSGLQGAGATALYPANVTDLLDRCFELYKARTGDPLTAQQNTLSDIFDEQLWWWTGSAAGGSLSKKTIGDFLSYDNGLNQGNLLDPFDGSPQPRGNGVDVGAYAD